jgi:hypothetical protein
MQKLISLLLILTFLVQPTLALADQHQFHQSGSEHLTFEHDHQNLSDHNQNSELTEKDLENNKNSDNTFDCHHCCHCHRVSHFALLLVVNPFDLQKPRTPRPIYSESTLPQVLSTILRPPKQLS